MSQQRFFQSPVITGKYIYIYINIIYITVWYGHIYIIIIICMWYSVEWRSSELKIWDGQWSESVWVGFCAQSSHSRSLCRWPTPHPVPVLVDDKLTGWMRRLHHRHRAEHHQRHGIICSSGLFQAKNCLIVCCNYRIIYLQYLAVDLIIMMHVNENTYCKGNACICDNGFRSSPLEALVASMIDLAYEGSWFVSCEWGPCAMSTSNSQKISGFSSATANKCQLAATWSIPVAVGWPVGISDGQVLLELHQQKDTGDARIWNSIARYC